MISICLSHTVRPMLPSLSRIHRQPQARNIGEELHSCGRDLRAHARTRRRRGQDRPVHEEKEPSGNSASQQVESNFSSQQTYSNSTYRHPLPARSKPEFSASKSQPESLWGEALPFKVKKGERWTGAVPQDVIIIAQPPQHDTSARTPADSGDTHDNIPGDGGDLARQQQRQRQAIGVVQKDNGTDQDRQQPKYQMKRAKQPGTDSSQNNTFGIPNGERASSVSGIQGSQTQDMSSAAEGSKSNDHKSSAGKWGKRNVQPKHTVHPKHQKRLQDKNRKLPAWQTALQQEQ